MSTTTELPTKLLWMDLEMTGLGAEQNVILEVVATITDFEFQPLATFEAVLARSPETLAAMDEWNTAHHTASGLVERVLRAGRPEAEVEAELATFIRQHFGAERAVLAGNTIYNDRSFIRRWWPEVEKLLHYRMLDVSAWKVLMQGKYGIDFPKRDLHQAQADLSESIAELKFYLQWFRDQQRP